MSDLFHESVTDEQIAAVFGVMASCPQHTFRVVTKRARRMREWFEWISGAYGTGPGRCCVPMVDGHGRVEVQWPLASVWLGVSAENQTEADERIPELRQTPAAVRFVSMEPLLGHVELALFRPTPSLDASGYGVDCSVSPRVDWVIVGGESGPGARPCDVDDVRSIARQCWLAGVSCFVKRLGSSPMMRRDTLEGRRKGDHPEREWPDGTRFGTTPGDEGTERHGRRVFLRSADGSDPAEWPMDVRVREYPK